MRNQWLIKLITDTPQSGGNGKYLLIANVGASVSAGAWTTDF